MNIPWYDEYTIWYAWFKEACRVLFFEQLVTLVMFFSGFFDVENHVSIMRKSEISVIFRAGPICQPVTGAASIEKKFFLLIFDTMCPKWVTSDSIQPPHSYYTNIIINKWFFLSQILFSLHAWEIESRYRYIVQWFDADLKVRI